jgi:hypothetical protein
MNEPKATLRVYTVVDVFRGCAEDARSFVRYTDARAYFRKLRKGRNLYIDDVQLFADTIELPARLAPSKRIMSRPLTKAPQ